MSEQITHRNGLTMRSDVYTGIPRDNCYRGGNNQPSDYIPVTPSLKHVYLDVTVTNNSNNFIQALFLQQTRSGSAFITNPALYNLAIIRLSCAADAVPVVYQEVGTVGGVPTPPIVPTHFVGSNMIASQNFWVGLTYSNGVPGGNSGTNYSAPVVIPANSYGLQATYNIYDFLNIVNKAWETAFTLFLNGEGSGKIDWGAPVMTYQNPGGNFQLNIPSYYATGFGGNNQIYVTMSYDLYTRFLLSTSSIVNPSNPTAAKDGVYFSQYNTGTNILPYASINIIDPAPGGPIPTPATPSTATWTQMSTDGGWPSSLFYINRLVITSGSLPVIPLQVATTFATNSATTASNNGNQTQTQILNFVVGRDVPWTPDASPFLYEPTLYRLIEMTGKNDLVTWDFSVYIQDVNGVQTPLNIRPGSNISILFAFIPKELAS